MIKKLEKLLDSASLFVDKHRKLTDLIFLLFLIVVVYLLSFISIIRNNLTFIGMVLNIVSLSFLLLSFFFELYITGDKKDNSKETFVHKIKFIKLHRKFFWSTPLFIILLFISPFNIIKIIMVALGINLFLICIVNFEKRIERLLKLYKEEYGEELNYKSNDLVFNFELNSENYKGEGKAIISKDKYEKIRKTRDHNLLK